MKNGKRMYGTMNKWYKSIITALLIGLVVTGATFFVSRNGQQVYCAPANPGPLDELSAAHQIERGFPFAYYVEEVPENCEIQDIFPLADADTSSHFSPLKFIADVSMFTILLQVLMPAFQRREKK